MGSCSFHDYDSNTVDLSARYARFDVIVVNQLAIEAQTTCASSHWDCFVYEKMIKFWIVEVRGGYL